MYLQIIAAIGVVAFIRFLALFYTARREVWKLQKANLPMPEFKLLAGHFAALKQTIQGMPPNATLHSIMLKLSQQFPSGIFYINLWPFSGTWMIVATMTAASQIQSLNLTKPAILRRPLETITGGPSLISMHGETWKRWRALFNPGFNPAYLIGLAPNIADEVAVFRNQLRKKAQQGDIFSLEPLTLRLTVDTICSVALDARLFHQQKDHPLAVALQRQIEWASFGTTFNPVKRYLTIRPLVLWYNSRLMNRLIGKEVDRVHNARPGYSSKSVISLALKQYLKEQSNGDTRQSLEAFKRQVAPQLRVFLFAGRDTTSSTLLYTFYLLAKHPEILERVRREHDEVFGTDIKKAQSCIAEDPQLLNKLPYTLAVIKETLRLFPPSASMREGRPDVEIVGDDGRRYPTAGCNVWTLTVALHHNSNHWPEVESFIPERWLVGPEDPLYPAKGAWRAFEFGPHSCIGQTLALLELRIALAMTLREFNITPAYDEWDRLHPRDTIKEVNGHRAYQMEKGGGGAHPADGLPCRVTLRTT
ncbi:aflN/ verA/ monooxygenase [Aspergillus ochraceoroseus]|uniref:AflN/ verA/ monooxygenase n=2 Tax=Aspergillus ochraceoroseus TaxID=138278 RepID=A0A0F8US28_9EURO|nr:aflN/ verA/ monooxygenase [Aspergillus ochraceoroseus]